jgi:hypothetical protein
MRLLQVKWYEFLPEGPAKVRRTRHWKKMEELG